MRFGTSEPLKWCNASDARQGCTQVASCVLNRATEAHMLARPFRFIAPALAALGLIALRLASPLIGPASPPSPGDEDGRVVFRHYF